MSSSNQVFDVIVVGAGGAGLAAAIEARVAGGSVLLLEKNAAPGGSTSWSVGSVTASNTPHQLAKGITDGPEQHWEDMAKFPGPPQDRDNDELRRILCDEMPDTFRWLLECGIRFYGPMPEPPHRVARMHNVLPNSTAFIQHLTRRASRAGVTLKTNSAVAGLTVEKARVVGVRLADGGACRAAGGVVLATGDFTASPELKARHMGEQEAKVEAVNATATGDGQSMAEALGARIVNGDLALGPEIRFIAPVGKTLVQRIPPWPALAGLMAWSLDALPDRLLRPFIMQFVTTALAPSPGLFEAGAILVNRDGARFTNELDRPALALPDQPDKIGYIILDRHLAEMFTRWPHFVSTAPGVAYAYLPDYRRNRPDVFNEAPDPDRLGRVLGMPCAALTATVAGRNAGTGNLRRLEDGPYVALGPVRSVFVHAEGGLAVDTRHRVLGADDQPIAGLYAAGSTGQGGLLLKGHGHHLAWAFASGRRAGRFAAAEAAPGPAR
jgi:fumarate reductase flavoprotein subunit